VWNINAALHVLGPALRVAVVSNWALPIGGAQIYATELASRLAESHDVLVLSGASDLRIAGAESLALPHLRPLHPDESAARKAAWHLRDQWRPTVHHAIKRELRRFGPDIVHTQEPQGLSAAVFTALTGTPAAHVHTAHDLNMLCVRTAMTRNGHACAGRCASCLLQRNVRSRFAGRRLDRLIAPSDYVREVHLSAGVVGPDAATTIRQAANDGLSREREPRPGELQVGFMGTLVRHKGILTLLEAFRAAPAGWQLHLAGGGVLDEAVSAACATDERITHHGYVTGDQKDVFFDRLDVLVIPSECEENAPLIAAEAVVRGLPCVVSDRGGLPETPEAWTFRAGDVSGLLATLRRRDEDPASLTGTSRALLGLRHDFGWPRHLEQLAAAYETAIGVRRFGMKA
jgi:glycosyltransferase involved in cell wall biosynthesis